MDQYTKYLTVQQTEHVTI